jgi:uncharacterized membrane protein
MNDMIVALCVIIVNLNVPLTCMYMWVINETETKSLNKFQQSVNSHASADINIWEQVQYTVKIIPMCRFKPVILFCN